MRVLYISDVYFPRVNGVSTSIATFREDLGRCGVESVLVAPEYGMEPASASDRDVIRVPSSAVPLDPEDRRMHRGALRRALDTLAAQRFDLVHIQTPFVAHYAGVRFARATRTPLVATYHTYFEDYLHHYVPVLPRPLGRYLARAFTRSQCRQVQALIAPSEPMRDVLLEYAVQTPIHVLPTGLPADRFERGDGARFRAFAGLPPERPIVLYVGRVAHEKNIEFLVQAFAAVRARRPDALLVIAGEGPARSALQQLVEREGLAADVRFVGYLDRERTLLDCYAAADVFVFASRTETQGLVLLEAMAQGAAVVSTAELGTRSVLKPASGARVVPERVGEFSAAVVELLSDAALRARLAEQGRCYAHTWSSQTLARRLADIYGEVGAAYTRATAGSALLS